MRERFLRGCVISLLAVACGGTGARPTEAPGAPAAPIANGPVEEGPPPDLSPVAAPPNLFGVGRLNRPGQLIDVLLNWSKLPIDWRRELANEAPGVDNVIDLNAPIDLALALPKGTRPNDLDDPRVVVSFGVRSLPAALEFARRRGKVERVAPGIYRIVDSSEACVIAAAIGTPPARLVCGDKPDDLEALLPYVTRGLPRESFGPADLHFELRAAPIRAAYGPKLRQIRLGLPFLMRSVALDIPRVDRQVSVAASALADEVLALVDDTDRAVFDLTVKTDAEALDTAFELRFTGKSSWSVQTLAEAGSRAAPPPDSFWRLPKDANGASFTGPVNQARYSGIRRVVTELLDGLLEHEKIPRRVRDQVAALIEETATTQAASVYAQGEVPPGEPPAKGAIPDRGSQMREQLRRSLGWYVVGIEDKADRYKTYFNRIVSLYNDRDLRRLAEKRADLKPAKIPQLRARAARGLPGSSAFELVLPAAMFEDDYAYAPPPPPARPGQPRPKAAPKPPPGRPMSIVLIIVPDGARTWFGFSADEKTLVEKLGVARQGAPAATLASREGLASLRTARTVSGGFWSLASLTSSLDSPLAAMPAESSIAELRRRLVTMPHQGQTPMPYALNVTTGGTTNLVWALRVPRAVAEDIGALIPTMGSHGGPPPIAVPPPKP